MDSAKIDVDDSYNIMDNYNNFELNNIGINDEKVYKIAQNIRNIQKLGSNEITYICSLSHNLKLQIILLYDHCMQELLMSLLRFK
jgi:hypothetical protein